MSLRPNILSILSLMIAFPLACYCQDTNKLLSLYFNEVRKSKYPPVPRQLTIAENAKATLAELPQYLTDSSANIRAKAYDLASLAGTSARQPSIREDAIIKLIEGIKDGDTGNAGIVLDHLTHFALQDFSPVAKDSVKSLFYRKPPHFDKVIRLVGFLDLKDLSEALRPLGLPGNARPIRWAATLSLARMQDAPARQELMNRVKKLPVNDDVIYEIFPDLIYTRDRAAINYMVELLHSDGKYCRTADAEREIPIPCGYRIMEQLAPIIKNYPLELDESGDIKTTDYLAALASVRYWFTKNKNFEIERERY